MAIGLDRKNSCVPHPSRTAASIRPLWRPRLPDPDPLVRAAGGDARTVGAPCQGPHLFPVGHEGETGKTGLGFPDQDHPVAPAGGEAGAIGTPGEIIHLGFVAPDFQENPSLFGIEDLNPAISSARCDPAAVRAPVQALDEAVSRLSQDTLLERRGVPAANGTVRVRSRNPPLPSLT